MSAGHLLTSVTILEMDFHSDPSIVSRTRRHIEGQYAEVTKDDDLAYRVSVVAYGRLENVSKYASSTRSTIEVACHAVRAATTVRVRTRNAASPERLVRLCQILDEETVQSDPRRFYDEMLERRTTVEDGESGLGLARIRAKARYADFLFGGREPRNDRRRVVGRRAC